MIRGSPPEDAEEPMPIGIACPASCGGWVGYNGRCTQCGAQAFEPPPWWERVLAGTVIAIIIASQCAAAPFYLLFVLGILSWILWKSHVVKTGTHIFSPQLSQTAPRRIGEGEESTVGPT
jgi:hypothetical protein